MNRYEIEQQQVTDAIALFPAVFGLRAFPGDVFRIGARSSCVSEGIVYLYIERQNGDRWQSFAKGTPAELRNQVVNLKEGK